MYAALISHGRLLSVDIRFKVIYRSKCAVSKYEYYRIDPLQSEKVKKKNQYVNKNNCRPKGDVFSSYLVIFQRLDPPFVRVGHNCVRSACAGENIIIIVHIEASFFLAQEEMRFFVYYWYEGSFDQLCCGY